MVDLEMFLCVSLGTSGAPGAPRDSPASPVVRKEVGYCIKSWGVH